MDADATPPAVARRAIVLFVPDPVAAKVDELRRRFDPVMAGRIGPHITLVHDVADHDRASALVDAADQLAPFPVRLTNTARWGPSRYGIYLDVEDPTGGVAELRQRLVDLEAPGWGGAPFRPHMTLVHGPTVTEVAAEQAWSSLDGFVADWTVDVVAIDVIELVEPRWQTVQRVELVGP